MSKKGTSHQADLPTGTWLDPTAESSVRYTIAETPDGVAITAVDFDDGEELEISDVSWDGWVLRFVTRMPSTGYIVEHEIRSLGRHEIEEATTRRTIWRKRPFT